MTRKELTVLRKHTSSLMTPTVPLTQMTKIKAPMRTMTAPLTKTVPRYTFSTLYSSHCGEIPDGWKGASRLVLAGT